MSIRMEFDWVDDAPRSSDALAQSTMATLAIEVDGRTVTSLLDGHRSSRNHVVVPLVHVAEWLVGNWWRILYEVENERTPRSGFAEAHDLAFVGEGFLLPKLTIASVAAGQMRLRWTGHQPSHSEIVFTEQGEAYVDRPAFEDAAQGIVEATLGKLADAGLSAEFLQEDWAAIQSANEDEREFCRAAALLGQDPFAVPPPLADQIIEFWGRVEPSVREDALATASEEDEEDLAALAIWLTDALERLGSSNGGTAWGDVRRTLSASSAPQPYQRGYELARALRAQLTPCSDRYDFATHGAHALPSIEMRSPSAHIQGLAAAHSPACATLARGAGRRFLLARALGDYMDTSTQGPAILSGLATDRQAQSRAFAAEFLAPAAILRQRLPRRRAYPEEVDDLSAELDVSSYVVRHQIKNHGLAEIAEW